MNFFYFFTSVALDGIIHQYIDKGTPVGVPFVYLAAGALAAVTAQVCAAAVVVVAAAAEQNDQNDNPPNTATAEAIAVTHNHYLRNSISEHWAHSMVFRRRKKVSANCSHIFPFPA